MYDDQVMSYDDRWLLPLAGEELRSFFNCYNKWKQVSFGSKGVGSCPVTASITGPTRVWGPDLTLKPSA